MAGRDRAARLVGALLGAALAGGCASLTVMSHMPLSTMSRLSSLKLAEIDPAELRVAARLPDALEPRSHGVKVRIEVAGMKHGKNSAMGAGADRAAKKTWRQNRQVRSRGLRAKRRPQLNFG